MSRDFIDREMLPPGKLVKDPVRKSCCYHVPDLDVFGLFFSDDRGSTWKHRCKIFYFQELFIHPKSGELFGIIHHRWLTEGSDGYLTYCSSNMVIRSENAGTHWTDLVKFNSDFTKVFSDPDNPSRVCVEGCGLRRFTLQSVDDDYSEWITYKSNEWEERQP